MFGGYVYGVSTVETELRIYPAGIKNYQHKSDFFIRPFIRPLNEGDGFKYKSIDNWKRHKIGEGYQLNLHMNNAIDTFTKNKQKVSRLMRYVLFIKIKLNEQIHWPYSPQKGQEIYLALSERITEPKGVSTTESTYAIVRQGLPRFTLHNSAHILLGTKEGILEYLVEQEEALQKTKELEKNMRKYTIYENQTIFTRIIINIYAVLHGQRKTGDR